MLLWNGRDKLGDVNVDEYEKKFCLKLWTGFVGIWIACIWDSLQAIFFQLNPCGHSPYVTSCLTRGWVCHLQFLLALASAVILRSECCGTHYHILLSDSRLPQPGGPGPRIYIPQEQGGPVIAPGTGFHFRRLIWLAGLRWRYSNPPPHGLYVVMAAGPHYI
jgi:hypothetical protein